MAAQPEMRERATSIFVTDVAFADIARQDGDLYRRVECASLAPTHDCVTRCRGASWGRLFPADPSGCPIGRLSSGAPRRSGFRRPSARAPVPH